MTISETLLVTLNVELTILLVLIINFINLKKHQLRVEGKLGKITESEKIYKRASKTIKKYNRIK